MHILADFEFFFFLGSRGSVDCGATYLILALDVHSTLPCFPSKVHCREGEMATRLQVLMMV